MRALFDVNVLIALLDDQHTDHEKAHRWLERHLAFGWASCPLTENGGLRILTNRRYRAPLPTGEVLARLAAVKSSGHHEFWPDDISFTDRERFDLTKSRGHQQITDVYLLGLAVHRGGRLATLDTSIRLEPVNGARLEHLVVL